MSDPLGEVLKEKLVISRHWDSPEIKVSIKNAGIELECTLEDFIAGLFHELKHPLMLLTRKGMEAEIVRAKTEVLNKIKEASIHSV